MRRPSFPLYVSISTDSFGHDDVFDLIYLLLTGPTLASELAFDQANVFQFKCEQEVEKRFSNSRFVPFSVTCCLESAFTKMINFVLFYNGREK